MEKNYWMPSLGIRQEEIASLAVDGEERALFVFAASIFHLKINHTFM